MIYHLTSRRAWQVAQQRGAYRADSLESEGFIHCSTRTQVMPVADEFFRGDSDLLLLKINPSLLSSELRWEPPAGSAPPPGVPQGDLFPHVYGPINLDAVLDAYDLASNPDGSHKFPPLD